jgi:hypothetical protein
MAKRYIGDAVVTIHYVGEYAGRDEYRGTVSAGKYRWRFDQLYAPAAGFRFAYDSPEAYDKMAASAVSFGSSREVAPPETADAISDATAWAQDDRGVYEVRRSLRGRAYRASENPLKPSGAEVALIVAGVAAVGLVGYLIWNATQQPSSQTASASSITGGGTTSLPPFTGGTSMPAASASPITQGGFPNAYEAGAGANAPLVPTGS